MTSWVTLSSSKLLKNATATNNGKRARKMAHEEIDDSVYFDTETEEVVFLLDEEESLAIGDIIADIEAKKNLEDK